MGERRIPGDRLVRQGLADLARGVDSAEALLVGIGAPRLRHLGFVVPPIEAPEHRLYHLLALSDPDGAHSRYNALLRRLTRFERACECAS